MAVSCKDCDFYAEATDSFEHDPNGECRRNAPTSYQTQHYVRLTAHWPTVKGYHWCGEWKSKNDFQP